MLSQSNSPGSDYAIRRGVGEASTYHTGSSSREQLLSYPGSLEDEQSTYPSPQPFTSGSQSVPTSPRAIERRNFHVYRKSPSAFSDKNNRVGSSRYSVTFEDEVNNIKPEEFKVMQRQMNEVDNSEGSTYTGTLPKWRVSDSVNHALFSNRYKELVTSQINSSKYLSPEQKRQFHLAMEQRINGQNSRENLGTEDPLKPWIKSASARRLLRLPPLQPIDNNMEQENMEPSKTADAQRQIYRLIEAQARSTKEAMEIPCQTSYDCAERYNDAKNTDRDRTETGIPIIAEQLAKETCSRIFSRMATNLSAIQENLSNQKVNRDETDSTQKKVSVVSNNQTAPSREIDIVSCERLCESNYKTSVTQTDLSMQRSETRAIQTSLECRVQTVDRESQYERRRSSAAHTQTTKGLYTKQFLPSAVTNIAPCQTRNTACDSKPLAQSVSRLCQTEPGKPRLVIQPQYSLVISRDELARSCSRETQCERQISKSQEMSTQTPDIERCESRSTLIPSKTDFACQTPDKRLVTTEYCEYKKDFACQTPAKMLEVTEKCKNKTDFACQTPTKTSYGCENNENKAAACQTPNKKISCRDFSAEETPPTHETTCQTETRLHRVGSGIKRKISGTLKKRPTPNRTMVITSSKAKQTMSSRKKSKRRNAGYKMAKCAETTNPVICKTSNKALTVTGGRCQSAVTYKLGEQYKRSQVENNEILKRTDTFIAQKRDEGRPASRAIDAFIPQKKDELCLCQNVRTKQGQYKSKSVEENLCFSRNERTIQQKTNPGEKDRWLIERSSDSLCTKTKKDKCSDLGQDQIKQKGYQPKQVEQNCFEKSIDFNDQRKNDACLNFEEATNRCRPVDIPKRSISATCIDVLSRQTKCTRKSRSKTNINSTETTIGNCQVKSKQCPKIRTHTGKDITKISAEIRAYVEERAKDFLPKIGTNPPGNLIVELSRVQDAVSRHVENIEVCGLGLQVPNEDARKIANDIDEALRLISRGSLKKRAQKELSYYLKELRLALMNRVKEQGGSNRYLVMLKQRLRDLNGSVLDVLLCGKSGKTELKDDVSVAKHTCGISQMKNRLADQLSTTGKHEQLTTSNSEPILVPGTGEQNKLLLKDEDNLAYYQYAWRPESDKSNSVTPECSVHGFQSRKTAKRPSEYGLLNVGIPRCPSHALADQSVRVWTRLRQGMALFRNCNYHLDKIPKSVLKTLAIIGATAATLHHTNVSLDMVMQLYDALACMLPGDQDKQLLYEDDVYLRFPAYFGGVRLTRQQIFEFQAI